MKFILVILSLVLASNTVMANELPFMSGFVVDTASFLTRDENEVIEREIDSNKLSALFPLNVVIFKSLEDQSFEEIRETIYNRWWHHNPKKPSLLLIDTQSRQSFISVNDESLENNELYKGKLLKNLDSYMRYGAYGLGLLTTTRQLLNPDTEKQKIPFYLNSNFFVFVFVANLFICLVGIKKVLRKNGASYEATQRII